MKDFKITNAKVLLPVISYAPIRGFYPPSIVVVGERLNLTQEVLYNSLQAEEFVISSSTRLIVRIPPSQIGQPLTDIKVLSSVSATKGSASINLQLASPLKTISGLDRLVQSWMLIFMTTPGSDIFSPESGGGALSLVGSRTDRRGKSAVADLALAVERTKSELLRLQSNIPNLPLSEKLLSASLASVQFDPGSTTLSGVVLLRNMLGSSTEISVQSE